MEDGTDRARRGTSRGSGGRRAAVDEDNGDDVLARHGLVGGGSAPGTGGRRRRPDDTPPPPSTTTGTGGRRRRPEPDEPAPEPPRRDPARRRPDASDPRLTERPPGRRRAPEPRADDAGERGGRRRAPDRPGRHTSPGLQDDPPESGRSAGGTGNFLDGNTARGRAALESSGALQRTRAVAPGWVRANDRPEGGADATTRLPARARRTDRDTAPNAKVPVRPDAATTAIPNRGRAAGRPGTQEIEQQSGAREPGRRRTEQSGRTRAHAPAHGRPESPAGARIVVQPGQDDRYDDADEHHEETGAERVARIDETLTRMTAAHAGLSLASDRVDGDDEDLAPPRPRLTPVRLICLLLTVVVLGAAGCGFAARAWLGRAVPTVDSLDAESSAIVDAAAQKGATNVLIVAGERETVPGTAPHDASTFAIAHVPADGGAVTVLGLPADLEINRPPCERFDPITRDYTTQPVQAEARTQLVSALTVGGPRCVTRVVQQLTGVAVTSYIGVDLDELARLADTVGGIGVCVTRPVVDAALGPIVPAAGTQQLDSARTLDYLHAAEVADDPPSGAGQVERQQGVLAASLAPLLSTTGLLDVGQLAAARPVLGRALVVDGLDLDQVQATARSLHKLDADGIRFVATPTMPGPAGGAVVLRGAEAAAVFAAVRTDKPLPTATGPDTDGPQPGDVKVEVRNASDKTGLANQVGDTLHQLGFAIGETGNATQRTSQTIIRYSPDRESAAKLLAGSVPSATTVPDPGSTGVLQLVLGRSFDDVVRPPSSAAPDPATGQSATTASGQCS